MSDLTAVTRPAVEVIPPEPIGETKTFEQVFGQINPCPVCGRNQQEAPEHEARLALHCWRCGYAPGQRVNATLLMPQQLDTQHLLAQLRQGVVEDLLKAFQAAGVAVPVPSPAVATQVTVQPQAPAGEG